MDLTELTPKEIAAIPKSVLEPLVVQHLIEQRGEAPPAYIKAHLEQLRRGHAVPGLTSKKTFTQQEIDDLF